MRPRAALPRVGREASFLTTSWAHRTVTRMRSLVAALALALALAPWAAPVRAAPAGPEIAPAFTPADVEPFFTGGRLARARADLAARRWDDAAAELAGAREPQARFLRALALVEGRRAADALRPLEGLEAALPDIADRVAFLRGRAYDASKAWGAAAEAYGGVPRGSFFWTEAQLSRARALQAKGDMTRALDVLAPVRLLAAPGDPTQTDGGAEALLLAGRLRAARQAPGEAAAARADFLACWADHPLSAAAPACRDDLAKLPGASGAPPDTEAAVRRAEVLLEDNRNAAALSELTALAPSMASLGPGPAGALACRARFALGKAHRKSRQPARAIELLRPVVDACPDPQLRVKALYLLARAFAIVAPEEAVKVYQTLARDFPAHPFADDALFYAADLLGRLGRSAEAQAALVDLARRYPQGDFRAEALFRSAWIDRAEGRKDAAVADLARIEREYDGVDPYEHGRAAYWRARILADRGAAPDVDAARAVWRALAERYPADYYGLLARARLEEARAGSSPPWPRAPTGQATPGFRYHPGALAADRHFRAGVLLLRMGLDRAASDELEAVDRKVVAGGEPLLLLAELLDRAGDPRSAHRLIRTAGRSTLRQPPVGDALRIWRVAYPPAFRSEVERWAPPAGVSPDLLLALMREESGLDPTIVSGAGAVGLTQLMLPTAQDIARRLHMRPVSQADLMNPPVAIRLGAAYLGTLLQRYGGSEALALAAYNVGDGPVRSWLRARGSLPLDAFVEEIPVQETRGYVKRVLRSYAAYRFLYGSASSKPVLIGQGLARPG